MIVVTSADVIAINRRFNGAENPWTDEHLLESAFSSYRYYEDELEQICSIFRGLIKNHHFSDGNKRTAYIVLISYLLQNNFDCPQEDLCILTLDVATHNYDVPEIAERLEKILIKD